MIYIGIGLLKEPRKPQHTEDCEIERNIAIIFGSYRDHFWIIFSERSDKIVGVTWTSSSYITCSI